MILRLIRAWRKLLKLDQDKQLTLRQRRDQFLGRPITDKIKKKRREPTRENKNKNRCHYHL